jgi:Fic family protein
MQLNLFMSDRIASIHKQLCNGEEEPGRTKTTGFFMQQMKGGTNEIFIHHHAYPPCT